MAENNLENLIKASMDKIHEMVDCQTVVGQPVTTPDGTTIIPVSKVSVGFASGGSDLPTKNPKDQFGGGSGAGISITPVAFIAISNGEVKLLQLTMEAAPSNSAINMVPEVIDKITDFIGKKKKGGADEAEEE